MKPTPDDAEPRRDGWFEHRGTWGEVTVGTVLASDRRSERWEVIDQAHGQQIEYGYTLWMRAREHTSGAEVTIKPHFKKSSVKILTTSPDTTRTPPPTEPSDAQAIALLVKELGATVLASQDATTGEITCPNYSMSYCNTDNYAREVIDHLRLAHGVTLGYDAEASAIVQAHGRAHSPRYPGVGKGGFPHRHVPEDLSSF